MVFCSTLCLLDLMYQVSSTGINDVACYLFPLLLELWQFSGRGCVHLWKVSSHFCSFTLHINIVFHQVYQLDDSYSKIVCSGKVSLQMRQWIVFPRSLERK